MLPQELHRRSRTRGTPSALASEEVDDPVVVLEDNEETEDKSLKSVMPPLSEAASASPAPSALAAASPAASTFMGKRWVLNLACRVRHLWTCGKILLRFARG